LLEKYTAYYVFFTKERYTTHIFQNIEWNKEIKFEAGKDRLNKQI
jgi:hypothetical protein